MMTIITRVKLRPGSTEQWDRAMHTRLEAARDAKARAEALAGALGLAPAPAVAAR